MKSFLFGLRIVGPIILFVMTMVIALSAGTITSAMLLNIMLAALASVYVLIDARLDVIDANLKASYESNSLATTQLISILQHLTQEPPHATETQDQAES